MAAVRRDGTVFTLDVTVTVFERRGVRLVTGIMSEVPRPPAPRFQRAAVAMADHEPPPTENRAEPPTRQLPIVLLIAPERETEALLGPDSAASGMSVSVATTAGLGLEMAKRRRPNAIVLVEGLPDSGVMSALEAIRADDELRAVPVLVVGVPADRRARLLRAGANAVYDRTEARRSLIDAALQGSYG